MFDGLGDALVVVGILLLSGAETEVGHHVEAGSFVFEPDAGHADAELVVGTGEAGQFVLIGPGEVIAVVHIGGAGNDNGSVRDG